MDLGPICLVIPLSHEGKCGPKLPRHRRPKLPGCINWDHKCKKMKEYSSFTVTCLDS